MQLIQKYVKLSDDIKRKVDITLGAQVCIDPDEDIKHSY